MTATYPDNEQEKLARMVGLLADDPGEPTGAQEIKKLQPRSRKTIGMATGGAIGSIIPGVGSLLGALIGYSLADSRWVANKMDQWLAE